MPTIGQEWQSRLRRLAPIAGVATAALVVAGAAHAASLDGRLTLREGKGRDAAAEMRGAVIYFTPDTPPEVAIPSQPVEIVTVRKDFVPRVTAIPRGATVRFPNQDPILHNVFSVSGRNRFDLGLVRRGEAGEVTLQSPGVVRVFCNVHHDMVAYVVVLETPYFTTPDGDGRFRLDDLPDGPGTLTVWHERAEPWTQATTLPSSTSFEVQIALTKPRVPAHNDKRGKPYRRRGRRY